MIYVSSSSDKWILHVSAVPTVYHISTFRFHPESSKIHMDFSQFHVINDSKMIRVSLNWEKWILQVIAAPTVCHTSTFRHHLEFTKIHVDITKIHLSNEKYYSDLIPHHFTSRWIGLSCYLVSSYSASLMLRGARWSRDIYVEMSNATSSMKIWLIIVPWVKSPLIWPSSRWAIITWSWLRLRYHLYI